MAPQAAVIYDSMVAKYVTWGHRQRVPKAFATQIALADLPTMSR